MTQALIVFVGAAGAVTGAGIQLARAGDEIAERAGLSRLFVGMLLVAGATSLPELVTDVSAAIADAPDLAVGDLFGSSMANMAILALVDVMHRHRVWPRVEIGHARVAAVAIALTALATLAIITPPGLALGWVGVDTVAIVTAYVAAVAWMRRSPTARFGESQVLPVPTGWTRPAPRTLRSAITRFTLGAVVILVAAPALVFVDVAYTPAALLRSVDPSQATAGTGAILMMALALAALVHGTETRVRRLEPDAALLLIVYLGVLFAVWSVRP